MSSMSLSEEAVNRIVEKIIAYEAKGFSEDEVAKERERLVEEERSLLPKPVEVIPSDFSANMISILTEEDTRANGGFHHPTFKAKLYLNKDGVKMVLTPEEIKQLVTAVGANFKR